MFHRPRHNTADRPHDTGQASENEISAEQSRMLEYVRRNAGSAQGHGGRRLNASMFRLNSDFPGNRDGRVYTGMDDVRQLDQWQRSGRLAFFYSHLGGH